MNLKWSEFQTIDWFNKWLAWFNGTDSIDRFQDWQKVEWKPVYVASVDINLTLLSLWLIHLLMQRNPKTMPLKGPPYKRCTMNTVCALHLSVCVILFCFIFLWTFVMFTFPSIFTFDKRGHIEERYIFPYGVDRDYK